MKTRFFYKDGTIETKDGIQLPYPCAPESIRWIAEYDGEEKIINLYNPNDVP